MIKNRILLILIVLVYITACKKGEKEIDTSKPNILFIVADDMRPETNTYGVDIAITPALDRLASKGVQFNNAYSQQAVCSASRASFLSSLRPDVAGCDYPYSEYYVNELLDKHPTIFRSFVEKGYELTTMGKLHHNYVEKVQKNHNEFRTQEYYDPENHARFENTQGSRKEKVKQQLPYELADMWIHRSKLTPFPEA